MGPQPPPFPSMPRPAYPDVPIVYYDRLPPDYTKPKNWVFTIVASDMNPHFPWIKAAHKSHRVMPVHGFVRTVHARCTNSQLPGVLLRVIAMQDRRHRMKVRCRGSVPRDMKLWLRAIGKTVYDPSNLTSAQRLALQNVPMCPIRSRRPPPPVPQEDNTPCQNQTPPPT